MCNKIKICGITNLKDYNFIVNMEVDFIGFIFYKESPRYINKFKVANIIKNGMKNKVKKVGVFVNESIKTIQEIFYYTKLDIIQLHGDETKEYCSKLNLPYWKVFRIKDDVSLKKINNYNCETILLDTFSNKKYGGIGKSFPIEIAKKALTLDKKIIIAGGVSIKNIKTILKLNPYAIDINSSIEKKAGVKDAKKTFELINYIKKYKNEI